MNKDEEIYKGFRIEYTVGMFLIHATIYNADYKWGKATGIFKEDARINARRIINNHIECEND